MTVVFLAKSFVDLEEAVIVAGILLSVPSVYLFVEEVIHDDVAMNSSSDVHIIDLGLLEIRIESDLVRHKNGGLSLVQLEPIVPVLQQFERLVDEIFHSFSLSIGFESYL